LKARLDASYSLFATPYSPSHKKTAVDATPRRLILFLEGSSKNKTAAIAGGRFGVGSITLQNRHRDEEYVFGRTGSDLLFQVLRLSTIGAGEFYGRVRDGIGYRPPAKTTSPAKDVLKQTVFHFQPLSYRQLKSFHETQTLQAACEHWK
jgi:hypothetical protein